MGTLFSLSQTSTSFWLDVSETALLIFGLILVVGVIGESAKSDKWKKWHRTFELMVILSVAGEFFADGGIFVFSRHLQTISDAELKIAITESGAAKKSADGASSAALSAQGSAELANKEAGKAELAAGKANAQAQSASLQVAALDEEARSAEKRALEAAEREAKLEQQLEWRRLSPKQVGDICKTLSPFSGTTLTMENIMSDAEGQQYAEDFREALQSKECGWTVDGPNSSSLIGVLPEGVLILVRDRTNRPAAVLQMALKAAGVENKAIRDPMMESGAIKLFVGIKPRPTSKDNNK